MVGYAALEWRGVPIISTSAANPPYKSRGKQITARYLRIAGL
ncbi:hypothetical protein SAMN05216206_0878 [Pseudomonas guineae]|uniref:Uncharacterized protein n=1 Tax=Pseudomonas guineae TaxID=425504 RepID=A0A1I3E9W7_9PSED|nr:hypothetical protein SAMN05216206_0878 [Pseudomonas guineae]